MRTQTPAYHIYLALPTLLWPSRPTGLPSDPVSMPTESECMMPSLIPLTLSKSSIPGSDASLNTAPSLGGAGGGRRLPLMGCLPFCLYQICDTTLEYTRAFTPFTRQLTLRRCEALTNHKLQFNAGVLVEGCGEGTGAGGQPEPRRSELATVPLSLPI